MGQIYSFSDAGLMQFLLGNKAITHFIVHGSLMLFPLPFALYLSELFPRWVRQYRILAGIYSGYFLLRVVLYALNLVEISQYISVTLALIALGLSCAAVLCLADTSLQSNRIMLSGIIVFSMFVFGAIILYFAVPHMETSLPKHSFTLAVGIDVLMIFFYAALLKSSLNIASHALLYEQQAYTDALTQAYNRAAFNLTLPTLDTESHPRLTLFMVDLNNLKQVNDTLGHPAGDSLICILVQCMEEAFGSMGKIYRYGGDEFVVVAPDIDLETARTASVRLNQLVQEHSQHGGLEISTAVGMASRQESGCGHLAAEELLHLADAAMYQIKAEQKNIPASEQVMRHKRLEQMDPSTGILSFPAFKSRVYNALINSEAHFPCIINFDLNFFDGYNILFGWNAGNMILQKMTAMALHLCGENGFCGHDYADSFWVFADVPDLEILTGRIVEETRIFQNSLDDCLLFPSFGIYCISERMLPVSDMCSRATSAKKRIKGRLDELYSVYSAEEHQRRTENMKMISYMQKALDNDEFVPFYQPKFTAEGRLAGAEALARWSHTDGQAASPAEFTALFEKSGLILSLDWYMLEKSCRYLRRYLDAGLKCVPVSVNFSRMHIFEADCLDHILRLVDGQSIPHELIEIELTETALVQDSDRILALISDLQAQGFSVSLDDFGSGVSSLGCLNSLRVDTIKIDRSLIITRGNSHAENHIFELVVELCRKLDIRTLAEGVETEEQIARLRACGCDLVQGNYFSVPLSQPDFEQLLMDRQGELQ